MSARLDALTKALKRLPKDLERQLAETVRENTAFLEDANTDQLALGQDATGAAIEPEYADLTVALKQIKGQPTDKVTLRDEGDFYTGIVAKFTGKAVQLVGTDPKTAELEEKYGDDIIGLPAAALEEFRQDYVKPDLQQATRRTLGL